MTFNVLTGTLTTFINALSGAQARVGAAGGLLSGLAIIEIVTFCLWMALDGGSVSEPFKKFMQLSFWCWFAAHFPALVKFFSDSLVQIALSAGGAGGNVGLILDPSKIAGMALDVTQPLVQSMQDAGITHLGDLILDAICYVILVASFFLIACQVCIAVIEYYLVVTLASCLIPFGISQHTRFLAEKAIGAAVAVSVKLMVLSFTVALIQPVLGQLHFSSTGNEVLLNESLAMCLVCILLAILVWRAPGFAADLLAASPSLSANAVGQHVTSAVSTGAAVLSGGTSLGAQAATAAASGAAGGGSRGGGAAGAFQHLASALHLGGRGGGGSGGTGAGGRDSATVASNTRPDAASGGRNGASSGGAAKAGGASANKSHV
ncbi:MAG TPA: type IV secretion system protein [Polyangia bacterium]|nr:type IV secretion system protein [Polyangia bacterium]